MGMFVHCLASLWIKFVCCGTKQSFGAFLRIAILPEYHLCMQMGQHQKLHVGGVSMLMCADAISTCALVKTVN